VQNTLLGIAIALILALVTALVGPHFVNWSSHRAFFEDEATRLVGVPVHVAGAINVSVLPTPSITLRAIEIGKPNDESRLRAGALAMELALGPLMRGELKAAEARVISPEFAVRLNRNGTVEWPNVAAGIKGDALSIERLTIAQGRIILVDAISGTRRVLENLSFTGDVRSLAGPYRGDGGFIIGDDAYFFRLSTGRVGDGGMKVKLVIDPSERALNIETEGTVTVENGTPRYEGNLTLNRPASAAKASGRAAVNEPWRATSKIKATADAAQFEEVEFQYGPEERAIKLSGTVEVKFGQQPRLQAVLSSRQVDLDRLVVKSDETRSEPFAAIKVLVEVFGGALRPAMPMRLSLNADQMTLGGATLQSVVSEVTARGDAWQIDRLEFRAPGYTQVRANGRLGLSAKTPGFAGNMSINATDSMSLLAWLTGRDNPTPGVMKPWHARGDVILTSDRIAVEQLHTEFDRATLEGRVAYTWPMESRPSSLEAELVATGLDVDACLQVAAATSSGLSLQWPHDLLLALDVEKARIAGVDTRKAAIRLQLDDRRFELKQLSIDGFGNVALEASGRVANLFSSPRGNLKLDVAAGDLTSVTVLAEKYLPQLVDPIRRIAGREQAVQLSADFGLESSSEGALKKRTTAKVKAQGQVGVFRLDVAASAATDTGAFLSLDLGALAASDVQVDGQVDTADGVVLLTAIGLGRMATAERRPARVKLVASGPLNGYLRVDGRLNAGLIDLSGTGSVSLPDNKPMSAEFTHVFGTVGSSKVQGKLALMFATPVRVEGAIEADRLDVPDAFATVVGTPLQQMKVVQQQTEAWSLEPFKPIATGLAGRIEIKAPHVVLSDKLVAKSMRGVLQFEAAKTEFEVVDCDLAGGMLTGQFAFLSSADGLSLLSYVELIGADAAAIMPGEKRPPIKGTLSLQTTVEGVGLSPAAFVGSLRGNGKFTLEKGQFAGLNPQVFDRLIGAVDLGIRADPKQINEFVTILLGTDYLPITKAEGSITFIGGQARLTEPRVEAEGADLTVTGKIDFPSASVDATFALSGSKATDVAGRPAVTVVLKGPIAAPRLSVNTDTLAGWLALRSAEQQSKRIETLEAARRAAMDKSLAISPPPARTIEEDDANAPVQSQAQPQASADPHPVLPETTSGIANMIQVPPLPPPITIKP